MSDIQKSICNMPIKVMPYRHQVKGFNECMANDGYGLLFDVGLGKSLTAVAVMGARFERGEVNKALVVCPLAVQSVWERECGNLTVPYTVKVLEGSTSKRVRALKQSGSQSAAASRCLDIAVINYEGARIMTDDLIRWPPDMIIVDESQRIKNPQSKQAKAVHTIAKGCRYRIILTATPIGNSVADVYSQWKVIDEDIFGRSFYAFRARYLVMGGYGNYQIVGFKNMPELLEKAHGKALRVTKEEALDLPAQVFESRYCKLEPAAKSVYEALRRECVSELSGGEITAANVLTKLLRLQQCAGGFLRPDGSEYYTQVSNAKLDLLEDTLTDILSAGEKVVVFCRFTEELEAISKMLGRNKINHETLSGAVKDKGGVVERFQTDPDIKVIVCQINVGGVGITLTAASVMIFYSTTFSLIDYLQAVGRTHRIGQTTRCLYLHLIASGTVDEHIFAAIKAKKSLSDNVVDNWKEVLGL